MGFCVGVYLIGLCVGKRMSKSAVGVFRFVGNGHVLRPQRIGCEIITTTNIVMMWVGARASINEMSILSI